GCATLVVHRRPRVAILPTGAELVEVGEPPGRGQVVNSNAYSLAAAAREAGAEPLVLPIARDRAADIRAGLARALEADVVLTSGGVSVGELDLVKDALAAAGVERVFWQVAQKPGRPLVFGRRGERLVFGLPGNPVSALVCFYLYVRPALRRMQGHRRLHLPVVHAVLAAPARKAKGLTEFLRVRLEETGDGPVATALAAQGSGVLSALGSGAALHRATGNRDLAWRFAKARARTLTWMLGVDVRLSGLEHLAGGGPFVFAPNHQSHLDILVLLGFLPGRTRFAAKKELWAHPVVGAVLDTLGMVPIDRDHPEQAIDALDRAAAERHPFVIFPEGTRSPR